jgi:outer membrane protein assembly factor BamA
VFDSSGLSITSKVLKTSTAELIERDFSSKAQVKNHMISRNLCLASLSFALSLLCSQIVAAQQTFKINKIEFEGLARTSADELLASIELKVGQTFDLTALDSAAQRLMDSGLFKKLAYSTRAERDQITITFRVEEARIGSSRVVFDNFIWFSDSELAAAIRRDVPGFTGSAPDSGDTVERIRKSLQRFILENKIEANVSHMVSQDTPGSPVQEHIFSVTDLNMPICTLHFPGSSAVSEAKLIQSSASLLSSEYSNKFVSLFATNNLVPIYRELGHLKVAFAPPTPKPESSANCNSGVDLTIPVDEGQIYKWNKAEWSGIQSLNATELDAILDMKSGQTVNGLKLDKARAEIQKAYGRKGYIQVRIRGVPEFDDTAATVVYKFDVLEGPQFRMGQLITKGFSERETKMLLDRWELKPGDIFDESYSSEFSKKHLGTILRSALNDRRVQNRPPPKIDWRPHLNREKLTVDLSVELTN